MFESSPVAKPHGGTWPCTTGSDWNGHWLRLYLEISRIPWYPMARLCFIVNCLWICHVPNNVVPGVTWQVDWPALLSHPLHFGYVSWRRDGWPNHRCSPTDCWLTFPHSSELPYPRAILPYAIFGRLPDSQTLYDMILVDIPISLHLLLIFLFSKWFIHSLGNNINQLLKRLHFLPKSEIPVIPGAIQPRPWRPGPDVAMSDDLITDLVLGPAVSKNSLALEIVAPGSKAPTTFFGGQNVEKCPIKKTWEN